MVNKTQITSSNHALKSLRVAQFADFLPRHERDALYDAVCAGQDLFQPPAGAGTEFGGSLMWSTESNDLDLPGARRVRKASDYLTERIKGILPDLFGALKIKPFPLSEISFSIVNGLNGHSGIPHVDSVIGRFRISYLYYFHRMPKAFEGGNLCFYAEDASSPKGHGDEAVAKIEHTDNLLVAYPSETFHGTTEVRCNSDDFADGRFAAIGFLGPE